MSLGSFIIIKDEARWIGAHLLSWLPHLDQMVLLDGGSTDGTLLITETVIKENAHGYKIKLVRDKDPKDLQDDYVRVFNEALQAVDCDLAFFLHPDMIFTGDPAAVRRVAVSDCIAAATEMTSYAGEPGGEILRVEGRAETWKNIYRLRDPDLGAHYFGHYGAKNEDIYFADITGRSHEFYGHMLDRYPYPVLREPGFRVAHFSDVRNYDRRLGRMKSCLRNQGYPVQSIDEIARTHPRVTLKDGEGFRFKPAEDDPAVKLYRSLDRVYAHLRKEPAAHV